MSAVRRPLPTIACLIFALGWPLVLAALVPNQDLRNEKQDLLILLCEWGSVGILFAIVTGWERLPFLPSVGFRPLQRADWTSGSRVSSERSCLRSRTRPATDSSRTSLASSRSARSYRWSTSGAGILPAASRSWLIDGFGLLLVPAFATIK